MQVSGCKVGFGLWVDQKEMRLAGAGFALDSGCGMAF